MNRIWEKDIEQLKTYFCDEWLQRCAMITTRHFSGKIHVYRKPIRYHGEVFTNDIIDATMAGNIADSVSRIAHKLLSVR